MSVHIEAKKGEIAETVLMPGDPLRAQWIAETFLENVFAITRSGECWGIQASLKGKEYQFKAVVWAYPPP